MLNLPKPKYGKCLHFIYGFFIFILANLFSNNYFSLSLVFIFACGKEFYDEYKYGGFNWIDLLYTIIPALILTLKTII